MNQPRQPQDPPTSEGVNPSSDPTENSQHGIPDGMGDAEPKGTPTSDRHETETTPKQPR